MAFSTNRLFKYQRGMRRRIGMLRAKNADSLDFAIDFMMQERVDSYFRIEPGLEEIDRSLQQIEEELETIRDLSGAIRLESRLEFVEDRWDELDSEVRERPRRRRRKINLADFLKAAGGERTDRLGQRSDQRLRRLSGPGPRIRHHARRCHDGLPATR